MGSGMHMCVSLSLSRLGQTVNTATLNCGLRGSFTCMPWPHVGELHLGKWPWHGSEVHRAIYTGEVCSVTVLGTVPLCFKLLHESRGCLTEDPEEGDMWSWGRGSICMLSVPFMSGTVMSAFFGSIFNFI